jgi:hypothetical protein
MRIRIGGDIETSVLMNTATPIGMAACEVETEEIQRSCWKLMRAVSCLRRALFVCVSVSRMKSGL